MNYLFKSEEDAINWVKNNIPFAITPTKPAKTTFISPFSSANAFFVVSEEIGKKIYQLQENSKIETNKDL